MSSSPHPCITVSSPPPLARHYNSSLSIWLSVDPMADKYPGVSPYTYCGNNPVRLVDADGRAWEILGEAYTPGTEYTGDNDRAKILWGTMEKIYSTPFGKKVIDRMNKVTTVYKITDAKCSKIDNPCYYNPDHTIYLNQSGDLTQQSAPLIKTLAHEMFHGYQYLKGQGGTSTHNETEAYMFEGILFGVSNNGLAPRRTDGLGDSYFEAFYKFKEWSSVLPKSEEEFNNVFDPIRNEFKQKSMANMQGAYKDYSTTSPKRNLLRDLIFEQ